MTYISRDKDPDQTKYSSDQDTDEIDLGDLLDILIDGRWLVVLIMLAVLLMGVLKALLDMPIYKADVMLQVNEQSQTLAGLETLEVLSSLSGDMPIMTEIELIKSRMILGEAVDNLNLDIIVQPKYFPLIGAAVARQYQKNNENNSVSSPLIGLSQYAWGGEVIQVDTFTTPGKLIDEEFVLLAGDQGSFQLLYDSELILEGKVGELASKQVGKIQEPITVFVSQLKSRPGTQFILKKLSNNSAISWLIENLTVKEKNKGAGILALTFESYSPASAVEILNEIANIYVRQNVEYKSAESKKTLAFLEKQLPILKEQLDTATNVLNDYRNQKGSINLGIETQQILKGIVETKTQVTLLQQERDELRQKYTPSHPTIVGLDKQITRLKKQLNEHDLAVKTLPDTQQVILELSGDVRVTAELYKALLNNTQTLRVSNAGTVGDVRIIDYAILPDEPIKPHKMFIIGVAFILGLLLGIVTVFIRKLIRRGVEDPDLIEKELNVPVYAAVAHSKSQETLNNKLNKHSNSMSHQAVILAVEDREDLAIESLRSLRTTLHFALLEARNNIILITGPSPGVGKSFVSINLATVMADAGKKILLIDGDMRKGTIHKFLGVGRDRGLSEITLNTITAEEAIRKIPLANIDFIPTGTIPPNPSELLLHEQFGSFMESISKRYDLVLIDSPPVLAVTDATIIGRLASATFMVVKAGAHPMRELEQSIRRLVQAGVDMKGIIFNNVPETSSRKGYGYGKYVYQYNYKKSKSENHNFKGYKWFRRLLNSLKNREK